MDEEEDNYDDHAYTRGEVEAIDDHPTSYLSYNNDTFDSARLNSYLDNTFNTMSTPITSQNQHTKYDFPTIRARTEDNFFKSPFKISDQSTIQKLRRPTFEDEDVPVRTFNRPRTPYGKTPTVQQDWDYHTHIINAAQTSYENWEPFPTAEYDSRIPVEETDVLDQDIANWPMLNLPDDPPPTLTVPTTPTNILNPQSALAATSETADESHPHSNGSSDTEDEKTESSAQSKPIQKRTKKPTITRPDPKLMMNTRFTVRDPSSLINSSSSTQVAVDAPFSDNRNPTNYYMSVDETPSCYAVNSRRIGKDVFILD
jgi:hypothetical protein